MWKVGTIEDFLGSWVSGIAYLVIDGQAVPCENASTVQALDDLFGGVIAPGHVVNVKAIIGKRVAYKVDGSGLLSSLAPAEMVERLNEAEPTEEPGREGVYVHTFKCLRCGLHFLVLSWYADRHRADNVVCPECKGTGRFLHWRAVLNERREFSLAEGGPHLRLDEVREIHQIAPWPGSTLLEVSATREE